MEEDTEGNYSFLLHHVEGRLAEHLPDLTTQSSSSSSPNKRPRLSTAIGGIGDTTMTSFASSSSSSDRLKLMAELDECRLLLEQGRDKFKALEDEFGRYREKTTKQLTYMESETNALKKEARERTDLYYEEKKKWQAKLRTLEAEMVETKSSSSSSGSASASSSSSAVPPTNTTISSSSSSSSSSSTVWETKFADMERMIRQKSKEIKSLGETNATLEESCSTLRRELILAQAKIGEKMQAEDEALETRDIKKRYGELETILRRKTRELDRLNQKVQNQTLLEEELSSVQTKLKLAQETLETNKNMQTEYHTLVAERKEWILLFQNIVHEQGQNHPEGMNTGGLKKTTGLTATTTTAMSTLHSSDINPTMVLRTLSDTQKQCVVLLKLHGELEVKLSELKKQLQMAESLATSSVKERDEKTFQLDRMKSRLNLAQQQSKLYENEISSLRSLYESFDAEFKIGRKKQQSVADDVLLKKKDELIATLRADLDECRLHAKGFVDKLDEREKLDASHGKPLLMPTTVETDDISKEEMSIPKETTEQLLKMALTREEELKEHLLALQSFAGVDFVPATTKVLHMIDNPTSRALNASTTAKNTMMSSIPRDQIKALKHQIIELQHRINEYEASAATSSSSSNEPNNQSMDMSALPQRGGYAIHGTTHGGLAFSRLSLPYPPLIITLNSALNATLTLYCYHIPFSTDTGTVASSSSSTANTADSNKLNQRLKEMFKERITAFREAVYLLTGYKVDLYAPEASTGGHARLRLRSMYAENPDDSFLFQWKGETLELLDTPFAGKLDPKLFAYLSSCNSVPSFLANVTLELFDNQTFLG